jgi:hypothetical protein
VLLAARSKQRELSNNQKSNENLAFNAIRGELHLSGSLPQVRMIKKKLAVSGGMFDF